MSKLLNSVNQRTQLAGEDRATVTDAIDIEAALERGGVVSGVTVDAYGEPAAGVALQLDLAAVAQATRGSREHGGRPGRLSQAHDRSRRRFGG